MTSTHEIPAEVVELGARAIFESPDFSAPVPWVEHGNSLKQDEARLYARAVLRAIGYAAPRATQSDEELLRQAYARGLNADEVNDAAWAEVVRRKELPATSLKHLLAAISQSRLAAAKKMRERCEDVAREHAELAGDGNGRAHIIADAIAALPLEEK